jgi:hypothetical protein
MEKVRYDILGEVQWSTLDALKNIQGELKTLEDSQYKKLRSQIIQNGFSYVVHVWRNDGGELCVLDGNQRVEALRRMQAEGVEVGMVPVLEVAAESEKEAFKKLLGGASQFGTPNKEYYEEFAKLSDLSLPEMADLSELPGLDDLSLPEPAAIPEVDSNPIDHENYVAPSIKQVVLYFQFDEYLKVMEMAAKASEQLRLTDNSELFKVLLEKHCEQNPSQQA